MPRPTAVVKEGERIPFTGKVGTSKWEAKSEVTVGCTSGTVAGEVTGAKSVGNTVIALSVGVAFEFTCAGVTK
jgi:hypothetical protein